MSSNPQSITPPNTTKTQPVHFDNRDIVFESGGVKFVIHVTADMTIPPVNPPNPITPVTPPNPQNPNLSLPILR